MQLDSLLAYAIAAAPGVASPLPAQELRRTRREYGAEVRLSWPVDTLPAEHLANDLVDAGVSDASPGRSRREARPGARPDPACPCDGHRTGAGARLDARLPRPRRRGHAPEGG